MSNEAILLGDDEYKTHEVHGERGRASGFSTWAEKELPEGSQFHPNFLQEGEIQTFNQATSLHIGYLDRVDTRRGAKDVIKIIQIDLEPGGQIQGPLLWEHAGSIGQKTAVPEAVPVYGWLALFLIPFFAYQYDHLYLPYPTSIVGLFLVASLLYLLLTMAVITGNLVHRFELKKSLRMNQLQLVSPTQQI